MKIGLATLAALTFILNAVAVRADGGDGSLIHACVAKDGTMRIVSATTACKSNETALHWASIARIVADETAIEELQGDSGGPSGAVITPPSPPYVFGNWSSVSFNSTNTVYDTDSYVGTNQFVIPQSGIYLITMRASNLQDNSFVGLAYKVNGGNQIEMCLSLGTAGAYPWCNGSELLNLNAGDTIEFAAYPSTNDLAGLRIGISKQ